MVIIKWSDSAWQLYNDMLEYARQEFGEKTCRKWEKELLSIYERLQLLPESYPLEELLKDKPIVFRRCSMMHRRFKLIYYYEENKRTVHIVDIWDSKMNPEALIKRITKNNV